MHWAAEKRVKLNLGHERKETVGVAVPSGHCRGLTGSFRVRVENREIAPSLAAEDILDGFSVEVDFDDGDTWQEDPDGRPVGTPAALKGVALTGYPAFDDAGGPDRGGETEGPDDRRAAGDTGRG